MPTLSNFAQFNISLTQFMALEKMPINCLGYEPEIGSTYTLYSNGITTMKYIAIHDGFAYSVPV